MPPVNSYHVSNTNRPMSPPTSADRKSFIVTISARALGSLGLGLSILAIWLRWIMPSSAVVPEMPIPQASNRRRRRSVPPLRLNPIPPAIRRVSAPVNGSQGNNRPKRVYFLDSPLPVIKSQQVLSSIERVSHTETMEQIVVLSPAFQPQLEETPESSSSTLVTNPISQVSTNQDVHEESIVESDSSSRRSSISIQLSKKIKPFLTKTRRGSNIVELTSDASMQPINPSSSDGTTPVRRSSIGFSTPWSVNRVRTTTTTTTTTEVSFEKDKPKDSSPSRLSLRRLSGSKRSTSLVSDVTSSLIDSTPPPSASGSSKKPHRRTSTPLPVQRTYPYEAPYFATPPVPFNPTYLRGLPKIEDNISSKPRPSDITDARGRELRQSVVESQAALGYGLPRPVLKRRSASETNSPRSQM